MADLVIHGEALARRLLERAEQEGQSVEDFLESMLMQDKSTTGDEPAPGSFAALAKAAREADISSPHPVDTSEHTKEILNAEFGEYLKRRRDEQ